MACAVLTRGRPQAKACATFSSLALILAAPSAAQRPCAADLSVGAPADRKVQVRAFQQALTSSPFYKELLHRAGRPLTCEMGLDNGAIKLSYSFRGKASLEAQADPGSESTAQRMQVRGMTVNAAMALLKKAEKDSFGQDGCGIAWAHPAEEVAGEQAGSREVVYRGDACNCQARLVYAGKSVVALILRSAC